MGMMVSSLSRIGTDIGLDYYVYVLYGGWADEIHRVIEANIRPIAQVAAKTNSAVIWGIDSVHFNNEVFSWHKVNGEEAEKLLPAILITTVHPETFRNDHDPFWNDHARKDHMLLIPLRDTPPDKVVETIRSMLEDLQSRQPVNRFRVAKRMKKGVAAAFMDGLILQPTVAGIGFDLKTLIQKKT